MVFEVLIVRYMFILDACIRLNVAITRAKRGLVLLGILTTTDVRLTPFLLDDVLPHNERHNTNFNDLLLNFVQMVLMLLRYYN